MSSILFALPSSVPVLTHSLTGRSRLRVECLTRKRRYKIQNFSVHAHEREAFSLPRGSCKTNSTNVECAVVHGHCESETHFRRVHTPQHRYTVHVTQLTVGILRYSTVRVLISLEYRLHGGRDGATWVLVWDGREADAARVEGPGLVTTDLAGYCSLAARGLVVGGRG